MKEITKSVARASGKTHSDCLTLIRLLCFACFLRNPFLVGYSKTYIGLEAQFRSTFQPVHKSYFEVFKGEIPREEAVRRDFISSRKVAHYALGIKQCLKLLEK